MEDKSISDKIRALQSAVLDFHQCVLEFMFEIKLYFLRSCLYLCQTTQLQSVCVCLQVYISTVMCFCMCIGFGTAVHGRWPILFPPSNTSRPTVTFLQMDTTWCPAATALEARAVKLRWDHLSWLCRAYCSLYRCSSIWDVQRWIDWLDQFTDAGDGYDAGWRIFWKRLTLSFVLSGVVSVLSALGSASAWL